MTSITQRVLGIAVAVIGGAGAQLRAQTPARLGLAVGATAPVSAYGNDKNVGYHVGLLIDVRIPQSVVGFRIDGSFNEMKYSGNSTKEDIWVTTADALLKLPTGGSVTPFVIGGAGIYNSHRTLVLGARSSTDPGVNVGGGVRFELHDATMFVEARYHKVSGDGRIRILPISLGFLY